ncbi:sucrase ferredoxin [Nocardioides ferulae]|uniref:sucrase ferredoxin n=1 Tax=Nocardioides ferulae TaxID=2340821 RepID=UPI000EAEE69A|nr:sucrase ferredoxin [Nocardioides ferulae]
MTGSLTPEAGFRCAAASALREEPLAGTASTVRAFLLLEHPGPWGVDALRDARLPDGLGARLRERAARARVRVLLIRRPGRDPSSRPRVVAAHAHPHHPWLEAGEVDDLHDVLDLDLAQLRAGRGVGLPRVGGSLFCVCTHGRHDACCAERGRPVAAALALARPDDSWEVSHIGGDRFAGNMLVLPHGHYYGRLTPEAAVEVAAAHDDGHLALDHLRGRSGLPMPVQQAEIALRRELAETRLDALRLTHRSATGDTTTATFAHAATGTAYDVVVRTVAGGGGEHQLTCRATRANPVPRHELVEIIRRSGEEDQSS